MLFSGLLGSLAASSFSEETLVTILDADSLARVTTLSARQESTIGEYASRALRRFANSASHEDWVSMMTALNSSKDPAATCLKRMINWALDGDELNSAAQLERATQ